ncbi:MAG: NAD-dependent epimerase/dehydratase family protein [Cyclobacteriaceae bacterium]
MNILLTGGNGFLGSVINNELEKYHNVYNLSRSKGDFICDLSKQSPDFSSHSFDGVVHVAGLAHQISGSAKSEFSKVNVLGTKNLFNSFKEKKPKWVVFISSVAVYGLEKGELIDETYPLSGSSDYALSKIEAENWLQEWGDEHEVSILILRLPLVVGDKPPGNLAKMIQGIKKGRYVSINKGKAKRSAVLAEDVAELLSVNFDKSGIYNLSDRNDFSFRELEEVICKLLGKNLPFSIPLFLAKYIGIIGDILDVSRFNSDVINKMTNELTFSSKRASEDLGWNPKKVIDNFPL